MLIQAYRFINQKCLSPLVDRSRMSGKLSSFDEVISNGHSIVSNKTTQETADNSLERPIWFHASSVGELEGLWNIILEVSKTQRVAITIFSGSAAKSLERLSAEVKEGAKDVNPNALAFSSYSPSEGNWSQSIKFVKPSLFVTVRYEAWPDLWASLSDEGVPILIIGGAWRGSLRWAKRACKIFGKEIPQLNFHCYQEADQNLLRENFPESNIQVGEDPRWERVHSRKKKRIEKPEKILKEMGRVPALGTTAVMGSVWMEDLAPWLKTGFSKEDQIWVVPHSVEHDPVKTIKESILTLHRDADISLYQVSEKKWIIEGKGPTWILVDEVGYLAELYSIADWVWVGGGFGRGVHSTIEPAIYGIPIGCGANGTVRFPEIEKLQLSQQLMVIDQPEGVGKFAQWAKEKSSQKDSKSNWISEVEARMSGKNEVVRLIEGLGERKSVN